MTSPGFRIVASARAGDPDALIAADAATCADCLAELFDPGNRRFRYPFINCTNCGPRFTIVRGVPYDRPLTTMAGFAMCADCVREYEDPGDRRFHAQPNACPACGPRVRLLDGDGRSLANFFRTPEADRQASGSDPISALAARLGEGAIAAVKGLGGYHLVCDAGNERAVAVLRARKHREDKPFALMVADSVSARRMVALDDSAETLLCSAARPIVLAPRLPDAAIAPSVAPGAPELGVMLPYTPLHHLLVNDFPGDALVMTSGNVSDEPIAYRDEDALERLAGIADVFLVHDREIETRTDDSVVRSVRGQPRMLRRSRGYVPAPLTLPIPASQPTLACGAEQKATFCVARGERAWVGHHIGDLEQLATLTAYREGIGHFQRMFAVDPELVAHDLHPDYLSTQYAFELDDVELVGVQHHHAHLAACLAEHGVTAPAVGAIFDGTGLGADGTVWGGELLGRRPARLRTRRMAVAGADAGRRGRRPSAVADGRGMAGGGAGRAATAAGHARARRLARRLGSRRPDRASGRAVAADVKHRPAVRRGRRAVRGACARQLRGTGGGRARGARVDGRGERIRRRLPV